MMEEIANSSSVPAVCCQPISDDSGLNRTRPTLHTTFKIKLQIEVSDNSRVKNEWSDCAVQSGENSFCVAWNLRIQIP